MAKIKISRIAYGSLSTTIGDGTLGYSSGTSFKAQEVCGLYIDIPPVLSRDYSSLIWQYHVDTDCYLLTHVQGRHVEDQAMGRIFSYRGAYEVSREEMNRLGFPVGDVMASMPRIKRYEKSEVWEDEMEIVKYRKHANADRVKGLAELLVYAVAAQKRIFISIPTRDRVLRENGVFATDEFCTLVEAIDSLDVNVRRYASFAFCVDEHYQKALDNVLVTFYVRESKFQVPDGNMVLEYEQIKPLNVLEQLTDYITVMKSLPGAKEPMLSLSNMQQQVQKDKTSYDAVRRILQKSATVDDLKLWFGSTDVLSSQIARFKSVVDAKSLGRVVAVLDASKDKDFIRQLFALRKGKRDDVARIVEDGLRQIALSKLTTLGPNADNWMNFLKELKDTETKSYDESRKFYLSMINKMDDQYVEAFRNDMVSYGKFHPRLAKDPRFELLTKTLHLQSQKKKKLTTEPKNPSNSQMQEEKGRTTNRVAEDSERCFDEFDRFYEQLENETKTSKTKEKIIASVASFVLGIALTAVVCFFVFRPEEEQVVPVGSVHAVSIDSVPPVMITLGDSTAGMLSQLQNAQKDSTHLISPDSVVFIDELKKVTTLSELDLVYTTWLRMYADTLKIGRMGVEVE